MGESGNNLVDGLVRLLDQKYGIAELVDYGPAYGRIKPKRNVAHIKVADTHLRLGCNPHTTWVNSKKASTRKDVGLRLEETFDAACRAIEADRKLAQEQIWRADALRRLKEAERAICYAVGYYRDMNVWTSPPALDVRLGGETIHVPAEKFDPRVQDGLVALLRGVRESVAQFKETYGL